MERSGGEPVRRGDAVLCDLSPVVGTEQAGVRPALVVQIDRANTVLTVRSNLEVNPRLR